MRKIIVFMATTLDGYIAGHHHEIDWHNVDEEFNEFALEQLDSVDMLLFGRTTYELMASYWPTPEAIADAPLIAEKMNGLPKIVFSKTLSALSWENSYLIKENLAAEIGKLKQQAGKDLIILGSSNLSASLIKLGLIDEFRIMINQVVLGGGKPLFDGITDRLILKSLKTRVFNSGNILLYSTPLR